MVQSCRDCGGSLEPGFIPDAYEANGASQFFFHAGWYPGSPSKGWFGGLKIKRENMHPLYAYRCQQCGLLKLYAQLPEDIS